MNHLVDPAIVDELYAASQAGASIDIIARTTCALRPGVEGLSENIRVRSIVGRFLEHSRIYAVRGGRATTTYIGSPDLMQRNLDHRIEVLVPVENARVRQEINAILDSALADDTNAWLLGPDGEWTRVATSKQAALAPRDDDAARRQAGAPQARERAWRLISRLDHENPAREGRRHRHRLEHGTTSRRGCRAAVESSQIRRERHYLRLGDDVHALGRIGPGKLDEAEKVAQPLRATRAQGRAPSDSRRS